MLQLGGLNRRVQPQCASGEVETKPGNANDDGQDRSGADILSPPRPLQTEGVTNTLARGLDLGEQEQSQQGRCDTEDDVRQLVEQIKPGTPGGHRRVELRGLLIHRHTAGESLDHSQNRVPRGLPQADGQEEDRLPQQAPIRQVAPHDSPARGLVQAPARGDGAPAIPHRQRLSTSDLPNSQILPGLSTIRRVQYRYQSRP